MKIKSWLIILGALALFFLPILSIALDWSDYDDFTAGQIASDDTFLVRDKSIAEGSSSATTVKEYSWTVMKADLKTYFDPLYAANTTGVNETYGIGWNADTDAPEKDDIFDYLHLLDTDDDGDIDTLDSSLLTLVIQADCSTITSGVCLDSDSVGGLLYCWDGDSSTVVACGGSGFEPIITLLATTKGGTGADTSAMSGIPLMTSGVVSLATADTNYPTYRFSAGITTNTFTEDDATPDITYGLVLNKNKWVWETNGSLGHAVTITDFHDSTGDHSEFSDNDTLYVWMDDAYTTIDFSSNAKIKGNAGVDFTGAADPPTLLVFVYETDSAAWVCMTLNAGLTSPSTMGIATLNLPTADADPAAVAGRIVHDTSDTDASAGGILEWHDATNTRRVVDGAASAAANYTVIVKTEFLPIGWAVSGTTPPATLAVVTGKEVNARSFTEGDDVVFWWVVPLDFIGGTVKYRVHYALSADASADETVVYSMTGCVVANSGDLDGSAGTALTIADELGTSDDQYQYMISDYSAASNADWNLVSGALARLAFSSAAAGDYAGGEPLVIGIEIKYKARINLVDTW